MLDQVPAWLGNALHNARAGHGRLAVARLASSDQLNRGGLTLRSAAFVDGEALDPSFTADEDDAVAPPLEWSAPPVGTQELALVVEDPDAPAPEPFCHWLVWGLAPAARPIARRRNAAAGGQEFVRQLGMAAARSAHRARAARLRVFQLFASTCR